MKTEDELLCEACTCTNTEHCVVCRGPKKERKDIDNTLGPMPLSYFIAQSEAEYKAKYGEKKNESK